MPMFKRPIVLIIAAALLLTGFSLPVRAQNNAGTVTCDSNLMLTWYIAGRYSGFDTVYGQMDPGSALDLSRFDRTQLGTLFDARQSASDPQTGMLPGMTVNQEFVNLALTTMRMDDAAFQTMLDGLRTAGTDISAIVRSGPASVPGEAPECGHLRQTLQRFFAAVAVYDWQSGFQLSFGPAQSGLIPAPIATEDAVNAPNPVSTEEARSDDDNGDDGSGHGGRGGDDDDGDNSGPGNRNDD